jgi:ribosomal protein L16 Arg81 hydroxylase
MTTWPTLERILSPFPARVFLNDYLGEQFLLVQGTPDKFAELISWKDVDELLERQPPGAPSVSIAKDEHKLARSSFLTSGTVGEVICASAIVAELQNGATLISDKVHHHNKSVHEAAAALTRELSTSVGVNLYAAWQHSPGFGLHWDDHDVFILQVHGRKKWTVHRPTMIHPLSADRGKAEMPTDYGATIPRR